MRSLCRETLQHNHSTKEQPRLWRINWRKTCPQANQKRHWLLPFLLGFVLVSAKIVKDGTRGTGEEGSSFGPPEVGGGAQNSRVGIRCGNSAKQINTLSLPFVKSPYAAFTAYGENGYFWVTTRPREGRRAASSKGNTAAPAAASEQRKPVSQWPVLCPLVHNYLDYSFPNVCFRVTDRCTA